MNHELHTIFNHPSSPIVIQNPLPDANWYKFGSAASANYSNVYPRVWTRVPDQCLWEIVWSSEADGYNDQCVALAVITQDGGNVIGPQIRSNVPQLAPRGLDVTEWLLPYIQLNNDNVQIGQVGLAGGARSPKIYTSRLSLLWFPD